MLIQLQRYPEINLVYKQGKSLHLADDLSRAHLEEQLTNAEQLDINLVEHMISDQQLVRFAEETKQDEILPDLQKVILSGWPETRSQIPAKLQEFWNYRDELTVGDGLVLKDQKIFVPKTLREAMLQRLHEGHLGINKTLMKARDVLLWLCYSSEQFKQFTQDWCFDHVTSSQSNGQSEKSVKTLKEMLEKSDDPYKALLSYRNTPLDGVNLSPAQMLMGRRLRTFIPVTEEMLKPSCMTLRK